MPAAHAGDRGLEVDNVRFHRLIIKCSDSDFERLLAFVGAPGFEIMSVVSPCRAPTATELSHKETVDRKHVQIRYDRMKNIRLPPGPSADTIAAVINVLYDLGDGIHARNALPYKTLVARLTDELRVSSRVARDRLDTVLRAGYLKEDYGNVLLPKHLMNGTEDEGGNGG